MVLISLGQSGNTIINGSQSMQAPGNRRVERIADPGKAARYQRAQLASLSPSVIAPFPVSPDNVVSMNGLGICQLIYVVQFKIVYRKNS